MRGLLTSHIANRARNDKGTQRTDQTAGERIDRMINLVLHRQDVFVVVDEADVTVAGVEEDLLCSEVVGWSIQADNEVTWE